MLERTLIRFSLEVPWKQIYKITEKSRDGSDEIL